MHAFGCVHECTLACGVDVEARALFQNLFLPLSTLVLRQGPYEVELPISDG